MIQKLKRLIWEEQDNKSLERYFILKYFVHFFFSKMIHILKILFFPLNFENLYQSQNSYLFSCHSSLFSLNYPMPFTIWPYNFSLFLSEWVKIGQVMSNSLWPHGIVHGILQARILKWVAFPLSRWSFQPRDRTQVSRVAGRFCISWANKKALSLSLDLPITLKQRVKNIFSEATYLQYFSNTFLKIKCLDYLWDKMV